MRRIKTLAMVLMLGLAGVVYAAGGMQTPTQSPDAKKEAAGCCAMHKQGDGQKAAHACEMKKDGAAACCTSGAACCEGKGSACCAQHKGSHAGHEQTATSSSAMKQEGAAACCASCEHCAKKKEKAGGSWNVADDAKVVSTTVEGGAPKSCCASDAGKSACPCCQAETAER